MAKRYDKISIIVLFSRYWKSCATYLGTGATEEVGAVEGEAHGAHKGASIISNEVDGGTAGCKVCAPCSTDTMSVWRKPLEDLDVLHDEDVVDTEDVDALNALGLELLELAHVSGEVGIAGRGEGSGDTNLCSDRICD